MSEDSGEAAIKISNKTEELIMAVKEFTHLHRRNIENATTIINSQAEEIRELRKQLAAKGR